MRTQWMALMTATALISSVAFAQPTTTAHDVPVLSGGVGMSDRAMIESQQSNYALKMVFSGQGGAFLSGVNVMLTDKTGNTVVSAITDGPILLVSPPAGSYKMSATVNGITKTRTVVAGKGLKTYQISFPISDDAELTTPDGTYLPKAAAPIDSYYSAPRVPATGYVPAPNRHAPTSVGE